MILPPGPPAHGYPSQIGRRPRVFRMPPSTVFIPLAADHIMLYVVSDLFEPRIQIRADLGAFSQFPVDLFGNDDFFFYRNDFQG